jgi:hypothetical protein
LLIYNDFLINGGNQTAYFMLRMLQEIPLIFQSLPETRGGSTRQERDMAARNKRPSLLSGRLFL